MKAKECNQVSMENSKQHAALERSASAFQLTCCLLSVCKGFPFEERVLFRLDKEMQLVALICFVINIE